MKYAYGNASSMHVTVTAEAMPSVRRMIVGYGGVRDRAEVVEVPRVDHLPGEGVVVQKPWIRSATSAAT